MPPRERRGPEFTVDEVAGMTGYSRITVHVWITRGHIRKNARGRIDGVALARYLLDRGYRGQQTHRRPQVDRLLRDLQTEHKGEVRPHG